MVDSTVWSLAFRRRPGAPLNPSELAVREALAGLVRAHTAMLIGPVRQEVLSGIREHSAFLRLREAMRAFPDEVIVAEDFEQAAEFANTCRATGVLASHIDFLVCSVAARLDVTVFSLDPDFARIVQHVPVRLHPLSASA